MRRKIKNTQSSLDELSIIAGRGVLTRSKKAIAAFKERKTPVGICVTLRGKRMYAFR
jgi:ribosomal protein L5